MHTLNIRLFPEQVVYIANHAATAACCRCDTLPLVRFQGRRGFRRRRHPSSMRRRWGRRGARRGVWRPSSVPRRREAGLRLARSSTASCAMPARAAAAGCARWLRPSFPTLPLVRRRRRCGLAGADPLLPMRAVYRATPGELRPAPWRPSTSSSGACSSRRDPLVAEAAVSGGVPTVWTDVLRHVEDDDDVVHFLVVCRPGHAGPRGKVDGGRGRAAGLGCPRDQPGHGARAAPRRGVWAGAARRPRWCAGVRLPAVSTGAVPVRWAPVGEMEVRGSMPFLFQIRRPRGSATAGCVPATSASSAPDGYVPLTDRAKDVIKSGGGERDPVGRAGERRVMGHAEVPGGGGDRRSPTSAGRSGPWRASSPAAAAGSLRRLRVPRRRGRAKWWLPERWSFMNRVPRTSVGGFEGRRCYARASPVVS